MKKKIGIESPVRIKIAPIIFNGLNCWSVIILVVDDTDAALVAVPAIDAILYCLGVEIFEIEGKGFCGVGAV